MSQLEGGHSVTMASGALGIRKLFWQGALFGLIEISAVIGFMRRWGRIISAAWRSLESNCLTGLCSGSVFCHVALYEEFTFRGYPQFALPGRRFWPAALLLSIAFGWCTGQSW